VVLRVPTMTDDKIKQKAIEAVADIYGHILYPLINVFWIMDCFAVETWNICF